MDNKEKNEELQSRRDFFKKAAKGALPFLGFAMLSANPIMAKAAEATSCGFTCQRGCGGGCKGGCSRSCKANCKDSCMDSCRTSCSGICKSSARSR